MQTTENITSPAIDQARLHWRAMKENEEIDPSPANSKRVDEALTAVRKAIADEKAAREASARERLALEAELDEKQKELSKIMKTAASPHREAIAAALGKIHDALVAIENDEQHASALSRDIARLGEQLGRGVGGGGPIEFHGVTREAYADFRRAVGLGFRDRRWMTAADHFSNASF